jgi:hypothetical protein
LLQGNRTFALAGGSGGGISQSGGTLKARSCAFIGNLATVNGGAVQLANAVAEIAASTLAFNTANASGGAISVVSNSELTLLNSTVSGNVADSAGGGIVALSATALRVLSSTVAFNTAIGNGGGIFANLAAELESTIVANNQAGDLGPDLRPSGPEFNVQRSLIGNTQDTGIFFAVNGNILNQDPLLGPLASNGGPTQTHALLPGSPAINAGSNPAGEAFDQRGPKFKRVKGGQADIGAFER